MIKPRLARQKLRRSPGRVPPRDSTQFLQSKKGFNHVLEHTQNPLTELQRARTLIADDGVLLVGVPNIAGLSIRLKNLQSRMGLKDQCWKHYGALHHLWFFTPATLSALVREAGFEVIAWETPATDRSDRSSWISAAVRAPLEVLRLGGILDLYARPC